VTGGAALPAAWHIGPARVTAGLDRWRRIDLATHRSLFGKPARLTARQLIGMADAVDLRGRGGAAFPVARKLAAVAASAQARRRPTVVVVNACEGEPGSAKDRMLLLRSPYLVLSGAVVAAIALGARDIVIGVPSDGVLGPAVSTALAAAPGLRRLARVVEVPDRFVSGEGGALVNAVNRKAALPPGNKRLASDSGVGGNPTLLSNAETFAQIAVLAALGPRGYGAVGTTDEPGTLLLTVGGSARRPAVVEVPAGLLLGEVLDLCGVTGSCGVLVGGYHGRWLPAETAERVPVSRDGLTAAGGTLGAGVVLPIGRGSCPLGEVARAAGYLASQSSGQCGPCRLGLPGIARALAALADGSGGMEALEAARRGAAAVRGRGACAHPDGVFRFVLSALDVFTEDIAAHVFRGSCELPVRGYLPLPQPAAEPARLAVDWTRCRGHGLCAHLVPELMQLDEQGYPISLDIPVPPWLERQARQAVEMCPALALRLTRPAPRPPGRGTAGSAEATSPDLAVTEAWIAELAGPGGRPRQLAR
jgi:NADH:ubiquinone oxidoreductase subunit F (NADH-binding)/ferredoxin